VCQHIQKGVPKYTKGCAKIYKRVCQNIQKGGPKYTKGCAKITKGCAKIYKRVCQNIQKGVSKYTKGCAKIYKRVCQNIQKDVPKYTAHRFKKIRIYLHYRHPLIDVDFFLSVFLLFANAVYVQFPDVLEVLT
jgi:hypothetical protein